MYVDGSFVTSKPDPADYDGLWDVEGADVFAVDPVFIDVAGYNNARFEQMMRFCGELYPLSTVAPTGHDLLRLFTHDRGGISKGIVRVDLETLP